MKKIFFIFLLLITNYSLLITNCEAQLPPFYIWRPVQSPVQAKINSINTQGYTYAVGNNGLFIYTYDYRYYPFRQVPGMKNINLNEIRQTNNIAMKIIVGNNGTIYRFPSDNYTQLTKESSGTNANLMGVSDNKCSMIPNFIIQESCRRYRWNNNSINLDFSRQLGSLGARNFRNNSKFKFYRFLFCFGRLFKSNRMYCRK